MPNERHRRLLDLLNAVGELSVAELSDRLGASAMTIRRDLAALELQGALSRRRGSAVSKTSRGAEPPFSLRLGEQSAAKRAVARRVVGEIADGHSVFLDSGTTCLEVARLLRGRPVTVMTVSLPAADALGDSDTVTTMVAGGRLRPHERTMIGYEAEQSIAALRFDVAVLGACGISLGSGITAFDPSDAAVKRIAISSSARTLVAATGDKLVRTAFAVVGPLSDVAKVITDDSALSERVETLRGAGVDVVVVAGLEASRPA